MASSLPGVDCGPYCKGSFANELLTGGQVVLLTATPADANSTFGSWTNCSSGNSTNPCTVSSAGDRTVTATFKANQTITFTNPGPQVFGTTPTLTATASSSLSPSFTSATAGVCKITAGGALTFISTGGCTIAANQAGNDNYNAAPQVQQSFTVTPAAQTISFTSTDPSATVGGPAYTPTATATSGLSVSFAIAPASSTICTLTSGQVSFQAAGVCTINANQAGNDNYNAATQVTQNLTVGKANQTITFGSAPSVVVGRTGTVSATGGNSSNPVLFTSTTPSVCTVSGSTVRGVAAGACTIAANQAGNDNYNAASPVNQTFTVNPDTINSYTLTVAKSGNGSGTVGGGGYFPYNTQVTPTATAATGSTFSGWSPASCASPFNLRADTTCTATFTLNTYLLRVNTAGTGSGTVSSGGNYAAGATVNLTAAPDTGSTFAGWSPSPCAASFKMPASALTCTATFTALPPNPDTVIWRNSQTGQVYGMLMDGFAIAQGGMIYQEPNLAWQIVGKGDFDGNGNSDLLWWNNATGQVYEMLMNGLSIVAGAQIYQEPNTTWQVVAVGDLNGDRKADLLWWNSQTGQVYGMLMDGFAIAQGAMLYQELNTAWQILAARDFNADGKADLLWRNTSTGHVYLMLMNGLSIASGAMIYHEPNLAWQIVAVGDLNGDGKADLIWWNNQTGQVYGMLMDGFAIAQGAMLYREANTAWQIVASGDYTGDGQTDLLWRNATTGQVYEMVMDGLRIASGAHIYQEADPNWRILATAADVPVQLLPEPGSPSAPLTGTPINAYQSFEGPLVNPAQPLSDAPLYFSVPPATP